MKEVKGGRDLSQLRKHENSAGLPGTGVALSQFCLQLAITLFYILITMCVLLLKSRA